MHMSALLVFFAVFIGAPAMPSTLESNKRIARQFFEEVLAMGRFDKYAESHAPDFVAHGEHDATLEENIAAAREERLAMPDMQVVVLRIVAQHDLVAVHWTANGTNTHAGMGPAASGVIAAPQPDRHPKTQRMR